MEHIGSTLENGNRDIMTRQAEKRKDLNLAAIEMRKELARKIAAHTSSTGKNPTAIPGLAHTHRTTPTACFLATYEPSVTVFVQGRKRVTSPTISQPPASQTNYTTDPAVEFSVTASGSLPLYYQWQFNGVNIPGATNQTYALAFPASSNAGSYTVVVQNIVTSVTSTPPAVLTVLQPVLSTNYVTNLWSLAPGSRSYLDGSSYNTRGLAYDTNFGAPMWRRLLATSMFSTPPTATTPARP